MNSIIVYTKPFCPYCTRAKQLLKQLNLEFSEIDVSKDGEQYQQMLTLSNRRTVPQIFINQQHIGGFDDLYHKYRNNQLDQYLKT